MAVVVAMLSTALPWEPIMAFLTSSLLMSPDEFIFISGIISARFAVALAIASVLIGLASGFAAHMIQKKTHFLDNQIRFGRDAGSPEKNCEDCNETQYCYEEDTLGEISGIAIKKTIKRFIKKCDKCLTSWRSK